MHKAGDPQQPICHGFDVLGFRQAQAMAFAVDEINRNSDLLPNVTLGYSLYDNCVKLGIGFRAALSLASGQEEQFMLNDTCVGNPPVIGIVGDSSSTRSIAISTVLGLYRVPMVRAMIQILRRFGWTWTGLLVSDDDYGLHAARSFRSDLAQSSGGCLAYLEVLPWGNNPFELKRIVDVMKKSTARVVIVFAHESHMINLMEEVNQFWEYTFHCRFAPPPAGWVEAGGALCTGKEDLTSLETEFLDVSNLRPEYNVYKAVYSLVYALDNMLQCEPGRGPFSGHSCGNLQRMEPWQV
ncbi:Vomeronasal type-2 receptor 1 [Dissostichus eleginoides]|uniref:Vomeronasal type-2 receptor 1 n=1 Tax=Dissostichus eleginoides TaxID=100907 RepID=A0AAD9CEM6_DISEL|nr:Vomeronasal type-2 receptor 1 [Dissostichus eleginoides]